MKLNETVSWGSASPADVYALMVDEAFRTAMCEQVRALSHDVSVVPKDDGATVTIRRTMPAQMPDFVKKLVGETVEILQVETWGTAAADGARKASVRVTVVGQPAQMTGTNEIGATKAGSDLSLSGDVTVKIPFLGKKIEPEVAKAIIASMRVDAREGVKRLGA